MLSIHALFAISIAVQAPDTIDAPVQAAPDEGESVCLAIGVHWRGDNEDIRRIAGIPVPPSYRAYFDAGGCTRWQLREQDLIDWHFAFGDEWTVARALTFLEADYLRGLPAPADYPRLLARAWQGAQADLSAVRAQDSARPDGWRQAGESFRASRRIARLTPLTRAYENYVFLAQHYLRAAEFHSSRALLDKARSFHAPAREAFALLYGESLTPSGIAAARVANDLGLSDWRVSEMHDLDMRIAIVEARLTRDPADIDAAAAILDRNFEPMLRTAVEDDERLLCDLDRERESEGDETRALRTACDDENFFQWRVIDFWRNRAQLDLLMAADPANYRVLHSTPRNSSSNFARIEAPGPEPISDYREGWNVDTAARLLHGAVENRPSGSIRDNGLKDQLIALHLMRADSMARFGDRSRRLSPDESGEVDNEVVALEVLWRAAMLAPPSEAPGRFRQIATRYLSLHRDVRARAAPTGDGPRRFPGQDRRAAYFRLVLDDLDRIAAGDSDRPR